MSDGKQRTAVIYSDWKDLIEEISNEDAGIIFKNLLRMLDNEMMLDEPSEKGVWRFISKKFGEGIQKWSEKSRANSRIAKERWEKSRQQKDDANVCERMQTHTNVCEPTIPQCETMPTVTVTVTNNSLKEKEIYKEKENQETENHFLDYPDDFEFLSNSKFLINKSFSFKLDNRNIKPYADSYGPQIISAVQSWLVKNKDGKEVDWRFIAKQFENFRKRSGRPLMMG